jgi:hypothetical protein
MLVRIVAMLANSERIVQGYIHRRTLRELVVNLLSSNKVQMA